MRRFLAVIALIASLALGTIAQTHATITAGIGPAVQFRFVQALVAVPYNNCATYVGAAGTVTWTLVAGSATQGGVTFTAGSGAGSGCLAGTPTATSGLSWTIKAADTSGHTSANFIVAITALGLTSIAVTPTGASVQTSGTLQMIATCTWGSAGFTSTCTAQVAWTGSGSPAGSFGSIGSATGILTAGASTGTVTTTATWQTKSGNTTVTVSSSNPTITTALTLCPGQIYQVYAEASGPCTTAGQGQQFAAGGGTPPYTWTVVSGTPTGLSLSSGGLLTGTPTSAMTFSSFVVNVTDSASHTSANSTFTLVVASQSVNSVCPLSLTTTYATCDAAVNISLVNGTNTALVDLQKFSDNSIALAPPVTNAGIHFVQAAGTSSGSSVTTLAQAFASNTAAASTIIVVATGVGTTVSSVTDTQSNTFTQACANGVSAVFYAKNITGGADTVTVHFAGTATFSVLGIHEYAGLDTSSPLDQCGSATGTGTAMNSSNKTTMSANELIFGYGSVDNSVSGAGSGYTLRLNNTQLGGDSTEDQTVSSTGAYATTMTQNVSGNWTMFIATFKAGSGATNAQAAFSISAGTGGTGTISIVGGQAQVTATSSSGTFLVVANVAGASTPASQNTVTITTQPPAGDTALVVSPSPAGGNVGSTVQFQAVGNVTSSSYTSTASWSSTNTTVATIASGGLATCLANGSATITASFAGLNAGNSTLTCSTVSGSGLLSGQTVTGCGTISGSTPAGYFIVFAERFDGGVLCNANQEFAGGTIQSGAGKSGSFGLAQFVNSDGAGPVLDLFSTQIGSFTTLYLSYWEWLDSNATENDEIFVADFSYHDSGGTLIQEVVSDRLPPGNVGFNLPNAYLAAEPQGTFIRSQINCGTAGITCNGSYNLNAGAWHQWEILFTPGSSSGQWTVYLDGALKISFTGDITGSVTMSGNTTAEVAGTYSKGIWTTNGQVGGPCSSAIGIGGPNFPGGTFAQLNAICPPLAPSFNRYVSDVILLKK